MLIFATFFASPNIQASHLPARGGRNSRSGLHGLFQLYCSLYGVLASLGWYSHPRLYVSLAILPVCQTCLHFQFWSAFGPKHGITGLGYTRPMYRWIMDPRVSAEPLKGNRSGAGQRWDGMSGMLEPCYKALDRTLRLLVSLISNIFTPFQTTDLERQSPIRDISPLFLIEVSYTHQQRWLAVSSQQLLSLQLPLSRLPLPRTTQRHRRSNTAMRSKRSPTHLRAQNTVRIDL